nr:hypothetical protein [Tanacetum cinerariifolium]
METEEISDIFMAPCFVNGLEAYNREMNLRVEENMILNEFAVKLCLEHDVKRRNKVVKKELIVALRGEIYFVKFIINPKEDDVEPGVPELDPFLVSSKEEENIGDDWDLLLDDLDCGDIPDIEGVDEERPVIETLAYSDKYKKILDEICLDKMKLDGMNKEEEEDTIKIKGEALIEKDDPGAFVILIRLKGKINLNALVITGSNINAEPMRLLSNVLYHVGVTTIIAKFLILDMPIDRDTSILAGRGFLHTCGGILNTIDNITSTFDGICH